MDLCLAAARAAASRRNGAKSRGPKTIEGKARSAQNALKHGLRAQKHIVLPGESATEFEALEAALLEELAPDGALQAVLARRVVAAAWRLERAERLEAGLFEHCLRGDRNLGVALIRDGNGRQGRVRERGPNPFLALAPGVRHAAALSRHDAGRAVARAAPAESPPGRAGGAPRPRHDGRTTDRTRAPRKSPRNRLRADDRPSRGHRRRVGAARGAANAQRKTSRTRSPRKSWRNRTGTSRGWREVPSARTPWSARSDAKMRQPCVVCASFIRRPCVTVCGRRLRRPRNLPRTGRAVLEACLAGGFALVRSAAALGRADWKVWALWVCSRSMDDGQ
jgi:hypothetical protein